MRYYVVWLKNRVSRDDDHWIKIKALDKQSAKRQAAAYVNEYRYTLGPVFTLAEMRREDPEILSFVWGKKAANEKD
jgi:hypothetical protein